MSQALTHPDDPLYERDFYAWTQQQAEKLRTRSHNDIDWETVAEEIESLGRSDKHQISNRIGKLLLHLLKWEHQPEKRKGGWLSTIREQRHRVHRLLKESPSLRDYPSSAIAEEYPYARLKAAAETKLPKAVFPPECAYGTDDVLSQDFLPGEPSPQADL